VTRLLLATTNPGKQRELGRLLASLPAELVTPQALGLALEVPEPHDSYAANASLKADAYRRASGLPTIADDSGIEVAALGWGPGVRSARFGARAGGDADALLDALGDAEDRRARMVCVVAVAVPDAGGGDGSPETFHGVVEGSIARTRRGEGGFGYDPIFVLPSGVTTAQLSDAEKDAVSHRGRAVRAALPRLRELLAFAR
jgi:XTP/dITP diphosphohydrolase